MQILRGELEQLDEATKERLMPGSTYIWPHPFALFKAEADKILGFYRANHIHAIPGDHVQGLRFVSRLLGVDFDGCGSTR
jgi:L-fucose/D-arabinose isomerase